MLRREDLIELPQPLEPHDDREIHEEIGALAKLARHVRLLDRVFLRLERGDAGLDGASRDLGLGDIAPVDPRAAGAADISFVAGDVEMAIDAMGLKGSADHTVDETADLRLLPVQIKRAAVLLHRLTR